MSHAGGRCPSARDLATHLAAADRLTDQARATSAVGDRLPPVTARW